MFSLYNFSNTLNNDIAHEKKRNNSNKGKVCTYVIPFCKTLLWQFKLQHEQARLHSNNMGGSIKLNSGSNKPS